MGIISRFFNKKDKSMIKEIEKKEITVTREIAGRTFTLRSGFFARQANGAVLASIDNTEVLGVATMGKQPIDANFFPLSVHYVEKYYSNRLIPGSYNRREGKPSDHEVLVSRLIDRPLRPLFADGFRNEVQIISTAKSMDDQFLPDVVGMIAASAALAVSDIPTKGIVGSVRVGLVNDELVINPSPSQIKESSLDLLISGTEKAITMIEGESKELSEEQILEAIEKSHEIIKEIIALQKELAEKIGKEKQMVTLYEYDKKLEEELRGEYYSQIETAFEESTKKTREVKVAEIYKTAVEKYSEKFPETNSQTKDILHDFEAEIVREIILKQEKRIDGRSMAEVRPIDCQTDVLKNVHGTGMFTRGETQVLSVVTVGSKKDNQRQDLVSPTEDKNFFLHYNFPSFSVGEVGRVGPVGRREIGHGMLAERSLRNAMDEEYLDKGYTVRIVSEVLESNGSSSMATVCSGSMALMNAGVGLKKSVAGIAMGLILNEQGEYQILTDIQGLEDHLGDMDFKVAGTKDGITGFQLDIKIEGITIEIMKKALAQAKEARLQILERMEQVISEPTGSKSSTPRIEEMQIPTNKIKDLIGPSGKNIKHIVETTGSSIDVDDSGIARVFSQNEETFIKTKEMIEDITVEKTVNVGEIYEGTVKGIKEFGAFVEVLPGLDGLCHISEFSEERVNNMEDVVQLGDTLKVKVIKVDPRTKKISLSHKQV